MPDLWCLISQMGYGKSTFASQMSPEYLVLNFDGRWDEVAAEARGKSHLINSTDVLDAAREMDRLAPTLKGKVSTVVIDSGTSVLDYIQSRSRLEARKASGDSSNFNATDIHRLKADTMRTLKGAVQQYQCNTLWIFHHQNGILHGKSYTRSTISDVELEKLKISLNAVLSIVLKDGRRGIKIEWSRFHNNAACGQVVWDTEGMWKSTPQRLSEFLRNFKGNEGYKGNHYSIEWLLKFLAEKGKSYPNVETMVQALNITETPLWFDHNGWGQIIRKAGVL